VRARLERLLLRARLDSASSPREKDSVLRADRETLIDSTPRECVASRVRARLVYSLLKANLIDSTPRERLTEFSPLEANCF